MAPMRRLILSGVLVLVVALAGCGRDPVEEQTSKDPEYRRAMNDLQDVLADAAAPHPSTRPDFKVPTADARGKDGLDLWNVVTDPMIDALSEVEDSGDLHRRLNDAQYVLWMAFILDVEVENGGLEQLYVNSAGWAAQDGVSALRDIGSPSRARALEQANRRLSPTRPVPKDQAARQLLLGSTGATFEDLDDVWVEEPLLETVAARYIRAHADQLFTE